MTIHFFCQHCGEKIHVPDAYAGKRGTCKHCSAKIAVPQPNARVAADLEGFAPAPRSSRRTPMIAATVAASIALLATIAWVLTTQLSDAPESSVPASSVAQQPADQPAPTPDSSNETSTLDDRIADLLPTAEEDRFLRIPWRTNLLQARVEASAQRKPMFMWVMNGDPLGCT